MTDCGIDLRDEHTHWQRGLDNSSTAPGTMTVAEGKREEGRGGSQKGGQGENGEAETEAKRVGKEVKGPGERRGAGERKERERDGGREGKRKKKKCGLSYTHALEF